MSRRYARHASQVVERFKGMLSASGRAHVGEGHFGELTLLIESAITTSVLQEMEQAADRLEKMAHAFRHHAETYETPPNASVE